MSDAYTTHRLRAPEGSVELCHLDGRVYVSTTGEIDAAQQPAGIDLDVRAEKPSAALLAKISASSPHVALIRERAVVRGQAWSDEQMAAFGLVFDAAADVPESLPARIGKFVLLEAGWLGPQITTTEQLDAAVLGAISQMIPAGLQRERAKLDWLESSEFQSSNPTLNAMVQKLGKTQAQKEALFVRGAAILRGDA